MYIKNKNEEYLPNEKLINNFYKFHDNFPLK